METIFEQEKQFKLPKGENNHSLESANKTYLYKFEGTTTS